ncbi:transposable element Tc1 transposase [Trichonephila clavipes]|nr:transposable element Tc1 transposase [Trichonephila clavipes]
MPPRRNKEKFQQLTEFERGKNIGLREGGFSYHAIGACVQRNSSIVMRVFKQWTGEHRTTRKIGSGRRKVTCTNVGFVNSSTSAAPWIACKVPLYRIPLKGNHRRLRLQWAHELRAWQADWHQVAFSDESRFNLWDHGGRIRVRRCAGERCLPECVIERHTGLTPGVRPKVVPFLQRIPGAIFQLDNTRPHVAKTVRNFRSAQHMQLLLCPAYSPDMPPMEYVWDLVGQRLARDPRHAASKDELLLRT